MSASMSNNSVLVGAGAVLGLFVSFAACEQTSQEPVVLGDPVAIIADIEGGEDVELGVTVTLDGTGSALGENVTDASLTYFWELETVPFGSTLVSESLLAPEGTEEVEAGDPAIVSFTPDLVGLYGITLQVSDGTRVSDLDHVVVNVTQPNNCPLADAGADLVALTGVPVTLDGTGSVDADVDEDGNPDSLEWIWHFSLVPNGSALTDSDIFSQGTASPVIVPDVPGTYILQLRVDDGSCTSEPDYVTVLVSNGNGQPVADAGLSVTLTPCSPSEVTLDGTGSFDPEGQTLGYEWTFTQVPNGSSMSDALIDGRFTATPSFNFDVPGLYTLQLRVNDGELVSAPDNVAVRAVPPLPNDAPVAIAGEDITVNANANCTSGAYTGCSCSPCGARSEVLSGAGSFDPNLDAINFQWDIQSGNATLLGEESQEVEIFVPEQNVNCNSVATNSVTLSLTVFDCRAAAEDTVTVNFTCTGTN